MIHLFRPILEMFRSSNRHLRQSVMAHVVCDTEPFVDDDRTQLETSRSCRADQLTVLCGVWRRWFLCRRFDYRISSPSSSSPVSVSRLRILVPRVEPVLRRRIGSWKSAPSITIFNTEYCGLRGESFPLGWSAHYFTLLTLLRLWLCGGG